MSTLSWDRQKWQVGGNRFQIIDTSRKIINYCVWKDVQFLKVVIDAFFDKYVLIATDLTVATPAYIGL